MKRVVVVSREDQVAGEVLVVRIRLNEVVRGNRGENHLPRDEPPSEPHVDVVGPQQAPPTDTILDEADRTIGDSLLRAQSSAP